MVYDHGIDELHKFMEHLKSLHPTIKFTYEFSEETINFFDVQVTNTADGRRTTDLYVKPTDAHSYLYHSSWHPHTQSAHYHTRKRYVFAEFALTQLTVTNDSKI